MWQTRVAEYAIDQELLSSCCRTNNIEKKLFAQLYKTDLSLTFVTKASFRVDYLFKASKFALHNVFSEKC